MLFLVNEVWRVYDTDLGVFQYNLGGAGWVTESVGGGDVTQAGTNIFTGQNTFNSSLILGGTGLANLQNGNVQLPGNLLTSNPNTTIVSGSDPAGQATLMFLPSGLERALTATPNDLTYNGNSLLGNVTLGGTNVFTGLNTFNLNPLIGDAQNNANRLDFTTVLSNNLYVDPGANRGAIYFQNDGDLTVANGNGAGPGNIRLDWNANTAPKNLHVSG